MGRKGIRGLSRFLNSQGGDSSERVGRILEGERLKRKSAEQLEFRIKALTDHLASLNSQLEGKKRLPDSANSQEKRKLAYELSLIQREIAEKTDVLHKLSSLRETPEN